ncbi:hypothetical protein XELAEV_18018855mg [Xenopus laevis]|nr:hypothetical protein XELAEV_18018855mg [Xenopus laevis]
MKLQNVTKRNIEIYKINQGILEANEKNDPDYLIRTSQAVDADYRNSGYNRGHVNPRLHHVTADGQNATFTFTNVAPMTKKLNNNIWNQYENKTIGYADGCTTMYVVTGIVPGNNWIKRMNTDRVNIPSYVWNAYCCVDNNDKPIKSGAGLKENDISDRPVNEMAINDLQGKLKHLLKFSGNIAMFFNNCA